ncbi:MAG: restriction endonuclease subunit M [Rikenellaceae bacterium]
MNNTIDIKENEILKLDRQLLTILLKDNSSKKNIIWATDNYEPLGDSYRSDSEIMVESIAGENGTIIRPRVSKTRDEQLSRVKDKAEVFTPSWICNKQNNLVDNAWFGSVEVFNIESDKGWTTLERPVIFPSQSGKSWQEYIQDVRLEISCGEAPYLASRYDTISGDPIPVNNRIGLLDRKLRIVSENTTDEQDWIKWAKVAFQSIYGYEWQGDNLILARENLLYTLLDFYKAKFNSTPPKSDTREIAKIISWNIWQMDGLKGVIPNSCTSTIKQSTDLFGGVEQITEQCVGCQKGDIHKHNGIYCKIKDWQTGGTLKFVSLLKQ